MPSVPSAVDDVDASRPVEEEDVVSDVSILQLYTCQMVCFTSSVPGEL